MAKYKLTCSAFIGGVLYNIKENDTITLPDDVIPSETFIPLDEAANEALERVLQKRNPLPVKTRRSNVRAVSGEVRGTDAVAEDVASTEAGLPE